MSVNVQKPGIQQRVEELELQAPHYAVCSSPSGDVEKTATVDSHFRLESGAKVTLRFAETNTATSPTLNVNGLGAREIRYQNSPDRWQYLPEYLAQDRTYEFVYDGEAWQLSGDVDTRLDITDSFELDDSTVAASAAAIKKLYEEVKSELSELKATMEEELAKRAYALTSDRWSTLTATTSGYNQTTYTVPGSSSDSWFYILILFRWDTGTNTYKVSQNGSYTGIGAGGTQVWSGTTYSYSSNIGGEDQSYSQMNIGVVLNVCWKLN